MKSAGSVLTFPGPAPLLPVAGAALTRVPFSSALPQAPHGVLLGGPVLAGRGVGRWKLPPLVPTIGMCCYL